MFKLTRKQEGMIHNLIIRLGKETYQAQKQRLGIPADIPFTQLTRRQAGQLISRLIDVRDGRR